MNEHPNNEERNNKAADAEAGGDETSAKYAARRGCCCTTLHTLRQGVANERKSVSSCDSIPTTNAFTLSF